LDIQVATIAFAVIPEIKNVVARGMVPRRGDRDVRRKCDATIFPKMWMGSWWEKMGVINVQ
jgi:hypothetical protein